MIEIKVQRVPGACTACKEAVEDAHATDCVRCRRTYHVNCWDDGGCRVCPPLAAAPEPAPPPEITPEPKHHGHTIPAGEEPRWLDKAKNVKTLAKVVYGVCGVLLVIEILGALGIGYHKHGHERIGTDSAFSFYPLAGFVAYSLVVVLGLGLQKLVMRREDYYDDE